MTPGFILILVATYSILVGADDFQELNCTDTDKVGYLCSDYRDDLQDTADTTFRTESSIASSIVGTFIVIVLIVVCCVYCSCCPLYRHRQKGKVHGFATTQQSPVTVYQPPPYSPQIMNNQTFMRPSQPGFIYSHGHTSSQTPNAPYYSAGNEHQINPGIGHYAGAPEQPPPYYQTSPPNHNMNYNFTSK